MPKVTWFWFSLKGCFAANVVSGSCPNLFCWTIHCAEHTNSSSPMSQCTAAQTVRRFLFKNLNFQHFMQNKSPFSQTKKGQKTPVSVQCGALSAHVFSQYSRCTPSAWSWSWTWPFWSLYVPLWCLRASSGSGTLLFDVLLNCLTYFITKWIPLVHCALLVLWTLRPIHWKLFHRLCQPPEVFDRFPFWPQASTYGSKNLLNPI